MAHRLKIYLHGAHVTSWVPAGGDERLFLSQKSEFRPGAAIRGGVPVIFPQFGGLGTLPKHGFARTLPWDLSSLGGDPGSSTAEFYPGRQRNDPTALASSVSGEDESIRWGNPVEIGFFRDEYRQQNRFHSPPRCTPTCEWKISSTPSSTVCTVYASTIQSTGLRLLIGWKWNKQNPRLISPER